MIGIRFWGMLYYTYNMDPRKKSIGFLYNPLNYPLPGQEASIWLCRGLQQQLHHLSGKGAWAVGFMVWGFTVWGSGFRGLGLGFGVWGLGFGVQGLGVQGFTGLGFRVWGFGV